MISAIRNLFIRMIGGTRNERLVRAMRRFVVEQVNPLEERFRAMTDEQLRGMTDELRARLDQGARPEEIRAEAFAAVREASRRGRNHRQYDVQLIAAQVLYDGKIAEQATGEGKTIACYPAIYMEALQGRRTHVITVNDYLVQRDAEFAEPIFALLGLTVGYIQSNMDNASRKQAYQCDITYGTNSEFGFDYLRDNMKLSVAEQVQGSLDFAIVDEIDSILIDEARTPLIISGPAYGDTDRYRKANQIARRLEELQSAANQQTRQRIQQWADEPPERFAHHPKFKEAIRKFQADPSQRSGFALTEEEAEALGHEQYFVVKADSKNIGLTHDGVTAAQEDKELGAIYQDGAEWPHLITQSLRARMVFEKDRDYVVQGSQVVIVDEFTGRLMEGRQWSDGLHQAVQAKENVPIKQENQTLATITLQNFFKLYDKLAGMTGTAMTESEEFMKIYQLEVVSVTTHRPVNRMDHDDRIYRGETDKYKAIVEEINEYSKAGRPVLVGTTSVEKSERLSSMLTHSYGVDHQVLNARPENAHREADIVAEAGLQRPLKKGDKRMVGTVTIATNMAGRGTDIKLGPGVVNPTCIVPPDDELPDGVAPSALYPAGVTKCCIHCQEYDPAANCAHCFKPQRDGEFPQRGREACREVVPCGLHIVGTERHEARRIDNQLRGRSGRQGDPGSSRFFLSLEDDLMKIFAGPTVLKMLSSTLGAGGEEHKLLSKSIEKAQKRVEQRNFDVRKHLLEYDEVMDHQRSTLYGRRQRALEGRDLKSVIVEMIEQTIADAVAEHMDPNYPRRCIVEWVRNNLRISIDEGKVRGSGPEDFDVIAEAIRGAVRDEAAQDIGRTIGEYVDTDLDRREWDLTGLSRWANTRYGVTVSQNQLRRMDPPEMEQTLIEAVHQRSEQLDLAPLATYLESDFAAAALAQWAKQKFGLTIEADKLTGGADGATEAIAAAALSAYRRREIEYPVELAMQRALPDGDTRNVHHVKALADWARAKYHADVEPEQLQDKPLGAVFDRLVGLSHDYAEQDRLAAEIDDHLASAGPDLAAAIRFARERFDTPMSEGDFEETDVREALLEVGRKYLRREINELERFVLLQEYDGAWKDHLLAMDHLKSGIGFRGYAEQDPKIAYKREGMMMFNEMFDLVRERVAENIFKVRLSGGANLSSVWQIGRVVHEQLAGYDHLTQDMQAQQQAASGENQKIETIRRDVPKVGRNDPCPCGSGKKYKKCCGRPA